MYKIEWMLCPACGSKTRDRIREDTILINSPLYCPKCKQETLINAKQLNITVIKEPDAEPITNENETRGCRFFIRRIAMLQILFKTAKLKKDYPTTIRQ